MASACVHQNVILELYYYQVCYRPSRMHRFAFQQEVEKSETVEEEHSDEDPDA